MATWRFVNFDFKESELLADLSGIVSDLKSASEICDLLTGQIDQQPMNLKLVEALNCALLVKYARPFASGVRKRVPRDIISELPEEYQKDHEWFIGLRDKYVAHSVNSFEENNVYAYLVPEERGPKGVSSISVHENRLIYLGKDDVGRLKRLAERIVKKVADLVEAERKNVLAFARSFPPEDFYIQKLKPVKVPSRDDVNKSRRKR